MRRSLSRAAAQRCEAWAAIGQAPGNAILSLCLCESVGRWVGTGLVWVGRKGNVLGTEGSRGCEDHLCGRVLPSSVGAALSCPFQRWPRPTPPKSLLWDSPA
jgi:hypothetical protein